MQNQQGQQNPQGQQGQNQQSQNQQNKNLGPQQNSGQNQKKEQKFAQLGVDNYRDPNPNGRMVVIVVISLIIGFVLGYGTSWLWNRHRSADLLENEAEMAENSEASTSPLVLAPATSAPNTISGTISTTSAGSITVANQPAGSQVFVSKAVFGDNGGWVSVQDDTNGVPGKILGAALFPAGSTAGEVPLLRATISGHTYFAVMRDNVGEYHLFNMQTDLPLTDSSGATVMAVFSAK